MNKFLFFLKNEKNLIGIRPLTQITCTCISMLFVDVYRAYMFIIPFTNKQINKQTACVLCVKYFTYMEICITLKYISLKQHPTPNLKREKKQTNKHPTSKYLIAL
jgi:hypothetical protein